MSLLQDMMDDLNLMFDDFGVDAALAPANAPASTVKVSFDAKFLVVMDGVESCSPAATCRTADVEHLKHNDEATINGVEYKIIGIEPDGTGRTVLLLTKIEER